MSDGSSKNAETFSLDALRSGDPVEFSRLVDAYSGRLYRLGLKMLDHTQDAEDILQEAFIKAYRGIRNFDGRSSLSTWLYRIMVNEVLMHLRRKRPETVSIDEPKDNVWDDSEPLQVIDWCCLPEEELMSAEVKSRLDAAIQKLPHRLRVVLLLREIEDLSTSETAQALNLTVTTVKTRLSRARMRLREDLSIYFSERMGNQADGTKGAL
jgi:RNA polymerase sigma-70 factor (ECF subfamily)